MEIMVLALFVSVGLVLMAVGYARLQARVRALEARVEWSEQFLMAHIDFAKIPDQYRDDH